MISAGEVIPISAENTLWIMRGAVNGAQNTFMMQNGSAYLFGRYLGGSGWGFVTVNQPGPLSPNIFRAATGGNGNLINTSGMKDIMDQLFKLGWRPATGAAVEEGLRMSIMESALWQISNTLHTWAVFFVPVSMQDVGNYLERPEMVQ